MNNLQLALLARIQAAVARVKGMEAANQQRVVSGETVEYVEDDFREEANRLELLATQALTTSE